MKLESQHNDGHSVALACIFILFWKSYDPLIMKNYDTKINSSSPLSNINIVFYVNVNYFVVTCT